MRAFQGPNRLSGNAVRLGSLLLDMLSPKGALFPSIATLAARLGVCADTIQRGLDRLCQLGFIDWTRRVRRVGELVQQTSNAYFFCCETGNQEGVLKGLIPLPQFDRGAPARGRKEALERDGGEATPQDDRAAAAGAVAILRLWGDQAAADRLAGRWAIR
jgi:hypothetical protein